MKNFKSGLITGIAYGLGYYAVTYIALKWYKNKLKKELEV